MKYYSTLFIFLLAYSSTLNFGMSPLLAMKGQEQENPTRPSRFRNIPDVSTSSSSQFETTISSLPPSFLELTEFTDIETITPIHVLSRYLLLGNFLGNHTEQERQKFSREGITKFLKEPSEARTLLERAALYGDISAMVFLGRIYKEKGMLSHALPWYTLAFQTNWEKTGTYHESSVRLLGELGIQEAVGFLLRIPNFFPLQKNLQTYEMIATNFANGTLEPYLSEEEMELRKAYFRQYVPGLLGDMFNFDNLGERNFPERVRKKRAAQLYWQARAPVSLQSIGSMLIKKEILFEDFQEIGIKKVFDLENKESFTHFELAARFYAEAGKPTALFDVGNMLRDGRVSINGLRKVGAFNLLKVKKDDHFTNFQLAAWLFKQSELSEGLIALGNMLEEGQITIQDLQKIGMRRLLKVKNPQDFTTAKVAASLYTRSSQTPHMSYALQGLDPLAVMILNEKITPQDFQKMGMHKLIGIKDVSGLTKFKLAAFLFIKAQTPGAFGQLGSMLSAQAISREELLAMGISSFFPEVINITLYTSLELAALLFAKSGILPSFNELGVMLATSMITVQTLHERGILNYLGMEAALHFTESELAALLFTKSATSLAFFNLGELVLSHKVTPQHIVAIGALNHLEEGIKLPSTPVELAALFFEKSQDSQAFDNLGYYYHNGTLGTDLTKEERLQKAANYFRASTTGYAKHKLARMYMDDQLEESIDFLSRLQKVISLLELAILDGHKEAQDYLEIIKEFLRLEQILKRYRKTSFEVLEEEAIVKEEAHLSPVLQSNSPAILPVISQQEDRISTSTPKPASPTKRRIKEKKEAPIKIRKEKIQKIKEKIRLLIEKIEKEKEDLTTPPSLASGYKQQDFTVEFLSEKVKSEFNAQFLQHLPSSSNKTQELLKDIFNKPWSTEGSGKPKLLKGALKGWWSRRINKKDRLVYRIESRKIIIGSCKGHYN